jgi:hypothetical protein
MLSSSFLSLSPKDEEQGDTNKTKNTKQANKQANPGASFLQQSHHYPQKTTTANKHRKNNQQQRHQ